MDFLLVDRGLPVVLTLRLAFVLFAACGVVALSFTTHFERHHQAIIASVGMVAGTLLVATLLVSRGIERVTFAGIILVLMVMFTLTYTRFIYALMAAIPPVAAYIAVATTSDRLPYQYAAYSTFLLLSGFAAGAVAGYQIERYARTNFLQARIIARERARSDDLLRNVLPEAIADRLKAAPGTIADGFEDVTVLFADIASFTPHSARLTPIDLVKLLDSVFSAFDGLADRFGLEKIKTIGDAYMVAGGLPNPRPDHALAIAEMALAMRDAAARFTWPGGEPLAMRIGISSGPVVAGVIGQSKFAYDLWGDTVNTASRMESHGEPSTIQVSEEAYAVLNGAYSFSAPRTLNVKGTGEMRTYFLEGRRA